MYSISDEWAPLSYHWPCPCLINGPVHIVSMAPLISYQSPCIHPHVPVFVLSMTLSIYHKYPVYILSMPLYIHILYLVLCASDDRPVFPTNGPVYFLPMALSISHLRPCMCFPAYILPMALHISYPWSCLYPINVPLYMYVFYQWLSLWIFCQKSHLHHVNTLQAWGLLDRSSILTLLQRIANKSTPIQS
jgi:hypothetical protein